MRTVNSRSISFDTMSLIIKQQLRAARAMLNWTQSELAERSGVSLPSIKRLEVGEGPLQIRLDTLRKLSVALEAAGVEFTNGEAPGVRLPKGPRTIAD